MKTLHIKILWGLGFPVILFVIVLLVANFFYVDYQIRELTDSYVNSMALEVDNKLNVQVKEVEELAKVVAAYLKQDIDMNKARVRPLLDNLLDADEKYDVFIVDKPLVIEGYIQGNNRSKIRQRDFNSADESRYRHYYEIAQRRDVWSRLVLEDGNWKTSYVVPFREASNHSDGIVVIDVLLSRLVNRLFNIQISEDATILFLVHLDNGEKKMLILDTSANNEFEQLHFNLPDMTDNVNDVVPMLRLSEDTTQIDDPIDGTGKTFIAQLPASFSPNVQLIVLLPKEKVFSYIYRAKLIESATVLIAFLGLVLLILLISKSISRPISALTQRVEVLAAGNLNIKFPVTDSCKELSSLSTNLNQTVTRLQSYFSDLKRVTAKNERINSEINISHDVQMSLLPHHKAGDGISDLDIYGCTLPAKEVGGDFYYFFQIDKYRMALLIGDVSGKGMPAAIMMAVCLSLFKAQSANTPQPDACLRKINHFLMQEDSEQSAFVTLFYAIFNTASGELNYANAGHNPPLIVRKSGSVEFLDQKHGIALAVSENPHYEVCTQWLDYGDMLLLYTDGITEAHDIKEQEFGEQRLIECIAGHDEITATQPARRCVQNIIKHVARFIRGSVQFDDMTLLCMVRQKTSDNLPSVGVGSSADDLKGHISELRDLQFKHQVSVRYDIKEIAKIIDLINTFCNDHDVEKEVATDLCVAADEFISNIIRHNEASEDTELIKAQLAKKGSTLFLVLEYKGKSFDPLQPSSLDIHEDWRERRLGGLGIHIGQQLTDYSSYIHADGRNILVVEKRV